MAIFSHSTTPVTPQTPAGEVLTSLVGRLRFHAKSIRNTEARRTMGADMLRAADIIEHMIAGMPQNQAAAAAMVAYLGRAGYAAYTGGAR